jgi:hypothetical protein
VADPQIIYRHKHLAYKPGHGYGHYAGRRSDGTIIWEAGRGGAQVESIIVHTTNRGIPSTLQSEVQFLFDTPNVSAHDVIGKDGTIVELLPSDQEAWHGGDVTPGFENKRSYGIEVHFTPGDPISQPQIDALTWRVRQRMAEFSIPVQRVQGHRHVAVPKGRKIDPSCFTDDEFYAWRAALYVPPPPVVVPPPVDDPPILWGDTYPYRPTWGVPRLWAPYRAELGEPLADEQRFDGMTGQVFEDGLVVWEPVDLRGVYLRKDKP